MKILVYKTDVTSKRKANRAAEALNNLPSVKQWNFDLEDCDKILRIVSNGLKPGSVESLMQSAGFNCELLEY